MDNIMIVEGSATELEDLNETETEELSKLLSRPYERSADDLRIIQGHLQRIEAFANFHHDLLQQLCWYGYYEDLDKGVILFRQGDVGTNWYAVLSGSLDVRVTETGDFKDAITLETLKTGSVFGESILNDTPHPATVVTSQFCELLRVEQRYFRLIWQKYRNLMESIPSPLTSLANSLIAGSPKIKRQSSGKGLLSRTKSGSPSKRPSTKLQTGKNVTAFDPAAPIIPAPSDKLSRAGTIVRSSILLRHPMMIQDRKVHARVYKKAMEGTEMVDWMISHPCVNSRQQAVGMWQALLEEGVIMHVCREHQFMDKSLFYRFIEDDEGYTMPNQASNKKDGEDELLDTLQTLTQIGPDAMLRMILRKAPSHRSLEDLELIYEELLHIKALSHLSTMVKRELASVIMFESHAKSQTVLFNQGDEGKSWYIILKGTVNVLIYGKGVVCTLREGDDFGKLALVNDAPRAATITTNEDNGHFLRVDKEDFNRILRDVEANTVRLNEHGHDVLVLEKIPMNKQNGDGSLQSHYKYSVMAGTPEKMLEYLLETRLESTTEETQDDFLEDFLLTHIIFMPYNKLCAALLSHYKSEGSGVQGPNNVDAEDFVIANKRRVVQFVNELQDIAGPLFVEDDTLKQFVEELGQLLHQDCKDHPKLLENASNLLLLNQNGKFKDMLNSPRKSDSKSLYKPQISKSTIKGTDDAQFKVYFADHTYSTVRVSNDATVKEILSCVKEKLGQQDGMVLCEVKSNGEKMIFKENDMSVTTGLSVNGRFFTSPREHLDALTPHPDQEGPNEGTSPILELMSTKDMAYYLVMNDWELFNNLHEYELIYLVFGRHKFRKTTGNLDVFLRQFNVVQYWVVTEMCLCNNLGKRVQLLRKLIKLAAYCKEYNNLNAFFAIIMGLSNTAVSRLSQTWESLPKKFKKMYAEFESLMDPSRNHRSYRLMVAKLEAPYIPFMPLLMKDLTFTHEGNKSHFDGLINFEKMHMVAQTLRTVRRCRSAPMKLDSPNSAKNTIEIRQYVRNLAVLDNQRRATTLSHQLEPRRS